MNKRHNHCIDILIHPKDTRRVKLEKVKIKMSKSSRGYLADAIWGLSEYDEEFKTKFKQLLNETKQRFQKEFNEL